MVSHMQATTPPDLIGSAEACAMLRIDRSTLTRWVKSGKITPVIRGNGKTGEMFFNRSDIEALKTTPVSAVTSPKSPPADAGASSVRRAS